MMPPMSRDLRRSISSLCFSNTLAVSKKISVLIPLAFNEISAFAQSKDSARPGFLKKSIERKLRTISEVKRVRSELSSGTC
jgi:hypothetical protein